MFKGKNKTLALLLLILMLVTACSPVSGRIYSKESSIPWPEAPDEINSKYRSSLIDFAWNLFKLSSENEGNVLISPASVYLALGMTCNGADGETHRALIDTLEAAGFSPEEFNEACRDYISILRVMGDNTELSVANSIWYKDNFPVSEEFLNLNANYFDAHLQSLDFTKTQAVDTINNWVKENTNNTIDKIMDRINQDAVMYLLNAVYFKSDWQKPFDPALTYEREFHSPKGRINADFMHQSGQMNYLDKNGLRGVVLPYDDGRFKFFALLPENGTDIQTLIHDLDGASIYDLLTSVKMENIDLALPKFETRFEDRLNDELSGMGMAIAFDPDKADFSLMVDKSKEYNENLYISEVHHKTYCKVDETGTEASAVTSVEVMPTSAEIEPERIELTFDRPFVYGIADEVTSAPLFLGIMENPLE